MQYDKDGKYYMKAVRNKKNLVNKGLKESLIIGGGGEI